MEERRDLFSEYLRKNWNGQQPAPGNDVWENISSSLDREAFDQTLRNGFRDFDAEPSPAVFDRLVNDLNEGRALNHGFDEWEEALPLPAFDQMRSELNDEVFDHSILESYHEWSGGNSRDLWNKLDEELSREAVWTRLQHSLASYTSSSATWKTIASIAAMLLLFFHLSDESDRPLYFGNNLDSFNSVSSDNGSAPATGTQVSKPASLASNAENRNPAFAAVTNAGNQRTKMTKSSPVRNSVKLRPGEHVPENASSSAQLTQLALNAENAAQPAITESGDVPSLSDLALNSGQNSLAVRFPEIPVTRAKNRFSVEFGPQLAVLTERDSDMGTATPGIGFGGGINYRYHIGPIIVSHGVNYSRYNQQCGDYINGHYRTGNQQLNAVQFNTTAGVEWNRIHVYGGLMLSRALSGLEKSGSTVTKIYHFDPIAPGLTAGVNFRLLNFKSSALGTGIQYSWVRGMSTRENSLTNVQGVRLNIVYSF